LQRLCRLQRPCRLYIFDSGYAACSGRAALPYIFLTAALPLATCSDRVAWKGSGHAAKTAAMPLVSAAALPLVNAQKMQRPGR
jgi:hypothetical protein